MPPLRIWIERRGSGDTAWAVFVEGEPWVLGLSKRDAQRHQHTLEVMASPEARAAARERIAGEFLTDN